MSRNLDKKEQIIERKAIDWNRKNKVEWPYGYNGQTARARQIAGWNGKTRLSNLDK